MNHPNKDYLGDSVYADLDDYGRLVLTTENGYPDDPRNRIILEGFVYVALLRYMARTKEGRKEQSSRQGPSALDERTEPVPGGPGSG